MKTVLVSLRAERGVLIAFADDALLVWVHDVAPSAGREVKVSGVLSERVTVNGKLEGFT
jgi:hypothetical protein